MTSALPTSPSEWPKSGGLLSPVPANKFSRHRRLRPPGHGLFPRIFSDTSKAHDEANVYLYRNVLEDVKKNTRDESLRNLYFDRTDLFEGYYKRLPSGTPPTLYLSMSAASPGDNVNYFESEKVGAEQQVAISLEGDRTKRWLQRNSTHFVQIIIPRLPRAGVFKLSNFADG